MINVIHPPKIAPLLPKYIVRYIDILPENPVINYLFRWAIRLKPGVVIIRNNFRGFSECCEVWYNRYLCEYPYIILHIEHWGIEFLTNFNSLNNTCMLLSLEEYIKWCFRKSTLLRFLIACIFPIRLNRNEWWREKSETLFYSGIFGWIKFISMFVLDSFYNFFFENSVQLFEKNHCNHCKFSISIKH